MGVYIDELNKFKVALKGLPSKITYEQLEDAFYDVSGVPAVRKDVEVLVRELFPYGRLGVETVTVDMVDVEISKMIAHEVEVASNTEDSIPAEVLWRIRAEAIYDAAHSLDAYISDVYTSKEGNYLRDVADSASKGHM